MSANTSDTQSQPDAFRTRFTAALEFLNTEQNQARLQSDAVFRNAQLNALRDMIKTGIPGDSKEARDDRAVFTNILNDFENEIDPSQAAQKSTKSESADPSQVRMETITQKLIRLLQEAAQRYYEKLEEKKAKQESPAENLADAPKQTTTPQPQSSQAAAAENANPTDTTREHPPKVWQEIAGKAQSNTSKTATDAVERKQADVLNKKIDNLVELLEKNASKWPITLRDLKEMKKRFAAGEEKSEFVAAVLKRYDSYVKDPSNATPSPTSPGIITRLDSIARLCTHPAALDGCNDSEVRRLHRCANSLGLVSEALSNGAYSSTSERYKDFNFIIGPVRVILEDSKQKAQSEGKPMNPAHEQLLEKIKDCDEAFVRRIDSRKQLMAEAAQEQPKEANPPAEEGSEVRP